MTYTEIEPFIGKKVIVKSKSGRTYLGSIHGPYGPYDTLSKKIEFDIMLSDHDYNVGIPMDEIRSIQEAMKPIL